MVVYSSRKRPGHPQSQIYIYDLETLKERRVTYQDGDCRDPIILKDLKHLVYASTTDELKESPLLLRPKDASSVYPFTDLYQSDFSGSDIDRLTQNAGFDGLPVQRIDRPQSITFSRAHDGKLAAYQLNLESKQSVLVLAKKDISIESLQVSPDKKQWAWIERTSDGKSQVFTGPYSLAASKHVPVELPAGEYKDVQWISPQKILMTAKTIKKYFQFYTYDFEKKCLQSLFDSNTDLSSPRLIAEKQSLIFASSQSGSSQIYYKTLPPPTEPCLALNSDQKPN